MRIHRIAAAAITGAACVLFGFACETHTDESTEDEPSGWCLCRSECAGLPAEATPEQVMADGALCKSSDCPDDHHCVVTAWSEQETMYYGKCYLACEAEDEQAARKVCAPNAGGNVYCDTKGLRESDADRHCVSTGAANCAIWDEIYDCRSQTLAYKVSCSDSTIITERVYHLGP